MYRRASGWTVCQLAGSRAVRAHDYFFISILFYAIAQVNGTPLARGGGGGGGGATMFMPGSQGSADGITPYTGEMPGRMVLGSELFEVFFGGGCCLSHSCDSFAHAAWYAEMGDCRCGIASVTHSHGPRRFRAPQHHFNRGSATTVWTLLPPLSDPSVSFHPPIE